MAYFRLSRSLIAARGGTFYQFPLSPTLSPLVPRGEREQNPASALRAEHNWFLTCQQLLASNILPITNRRYGGLKICATLNAYQASRLPRERTSASGKANLPRL